MALNPIEPGGMSLCSLRKVRRRGEDNSHSKVKMNPLTSTKFPRSATTIDLNFLKSSGPTYTLFVRARSSFGSLIALMGILVAIYCKCEIIKEEVKLQRRSSSEKTRKAKKTKKNTLNMKI